MILHLWWNTSWAWKITESNTEKEAVGREQYVPCGGFVLKGSIMVSIILASSSPRRRDLIGQMGWEPVLCKGNFSEIRTPEEGRGRMSLLPEAGQKELSRFSGPDFVTVFNAYGKGLDAAEKHAGESPVLSADTVVSAEGKILGKPADEGEAFAMLSFLSGRVHEVKTGIALFYHGQVRLDCCTTRVYFRNLDKEEILAYIGTGEPMDKAGAYGIQGRGAVLADHIEGDYNNVVGLPLTRVYEILREWKAL